MIRYDHFLSCEQYRPTDLVHQPSWQKKQASTHSQGIDAYQDAGAR
jgi:hypothetical protein